MSFNSVFFLEAQFQQYPATRRARFLPIAPISPRSALVLASVQWADGEQTEVNVINLERQPGV